MALESGSRIADLNISNPLPGDSGGEGDDHIRLIKTILKNLLTGTPGLAEPQTIQINNGEITISSSIIFLTSQVGGVGDVLNKINVSGTFLGNIIILRPADGALEPITIENLESGAGRIVLDEGTSHLMNSVSHFMILFRDSSDRWRELLRKARPAPNKRMILTSETYVVPTGVRRLRVRGVGAGGGGGGAGAGNTAGGGGGGGCFVERFFSRTELDDSIAVDIGEGGTAGSSAGGDGGDGGPTRFGDFWRAAGGKGGIGMASSVANAQAAGGDGGTLTLGSGDVVIEGGHGNVGRLDGDGLPQASNFGGAPGWELWTQGAVGVNGMHAAQGYGVGGMGGNRTSGATAGHVGRPGAIELTEYF